MDKGELVVQCGPGQCWDPGGVGDPRGGDIGFVRVLELIVGSRAAKTPYDLAHHFKTQGNVFTDEQTIETTRDMGVGKDQRPRQVVCQYRFKRSKNDDRAINAMIARAETVATGTHPLKWTDS